MNDPLLLAHVRELLNWIADRLDNPKDPYPTQDRAADAATLRNVARKLS